jgi:hypothetical protein
MTKQLTIDLIGAYIPIISVFCQWIYLYTQRKIAARAKKAIFPKTESTPA